MLLFFNFAFSIHLFRLTIELLNIFWRRLNISNIKISICTKALLSNHADVAYLFIIILIN